MGAAGGYAAGAIFKFDRPLMSGPPKAPVDSSRTSLFAMTVPALCRSWSVKRIFLGLRVAQLCNLVPAEFCDDQLRQGLVGIVVTAFEPQ